MKRLTKAFLCLMMALLCALPMLACGEEPEEITVSVSAVSVTVGEEKALDVTVAGATEYTLTYSSSDETVATVDKGKVKGVKVGTATVTVTVTAGETTVSGECVVTVAAAPVTEYTVAFNVDGQIQTVSVVKGEPVQRPADPVKADDAEYRYTFKGWYVGNEEYDFSKPVVRPLVLKAQFTAEHYQDRTVLFEMPKAIVGGKQYALLQYDADDFAQAEITLKENGNSIDFTRNATVGSITARLVPGEYELSVTYDTTKVYTLTVTESVTAYKITVDTDNVVIVYKNGNEEYAVQLVDSGSTAPSVAEPVKESSRVYEYGFAGWLNGTEPFDANEPITEHTVLSASFNESIREYETTVEAVAESIVAFDKAYPSFDFSDVTYTVVDGDSQPAVKNGDKYVLKADKSYTVTATSGKYTGTATVAEPDGSGVSVVLDNNHRVGGKVWGEAFDGVEREYSSYGSNYTVHADDSITLTGITFAYMNAPYVDKYYFETEIDMPITSGGQMVGIIAASERKNLSGSTGAGGENDKLGKMLVFALSGGDGKTLFYRNESGYGGSGIITIGKQYAGCAFDKANTGVATKLAVARNGNKYYIFINNVHVYTHESTEYGKGVVGFQLSSNSMTNPCRYDNIKLTISSDAVDDVIASKVNDNNPMLGPVTGNDWATGENGSGSVTGGYGAILGNAKGSTYYVEATIRKDDAWRGIIVNTLGATAAQLQYVDGTTVKPYGWYGFGFLGASLYMHEFQTAWTQGTRLTLLDGVTVTNTNSIDYKLGVLRDKDYYYVFYNDTLIWYGQKKAYAYNSSTTELAADNESAFGMYCGANTKQTLRYSGFSAVVGSDALKAAPTATVNYSVKLDGKTATAYQSIGGKSVAIANGGKALAGIPVEFKTTESGTALDTVTLKAGEVFNLFVDDTVTGKGTVAATVAAQTLDVGDGEYAYVDETVDASEVEITLVNHATQAESTYTVASLNEAELDAGTYDLFVKVKGVTTHEVITIKAGEENAITLMVGRAHLGGAVTIGSITYDSFKNCAIDATSGSGWALINGRRDAVNLTSHTFVMQNGVVGDSYYLEGKFDSTVTLIRGEMFAGLMVAHNTDFDLDDSPSDNKLVVGIYSDYLLVSLAKGWSSADTRALAKLSELGIKVNNPRAVKLGVLREKDIFHFFVDGQFVTTYCVPEVAKESGFGLARLCGSAYRIVPVTDFRYSVNSALLTALKGQVNGDKEIDLFFIAGQSNGSGYSVIDKSSAQYDSVADTYAFGGRVFYAGDAESSTWSGSTVTGSNHNKLSWQLVRYGMGRSANHIGAEAGMAEAINAAYAEMGKDAGIIKMAHGGTALRDIITGENIPSGNWAPPSYLAKYGKKHETISGGLYNKLLAEVETRVAELKRMGYTKFNFKGLFWMQGCADRSVPAEYKEIFKLFVSDIRNDLGEIASAANGTTVDLSTFEIYVGEISETFGSALTGNVATNNAFIAMQNDLANEISNVTVVDSSPLKINASLDGGATTKVVGTDQYHWSMEDMLSIGRRWGEAILND